MNLASVDGTIGPAAEARIPASDEGLLRGDGIFEVMRLYEGRPYALGAHLARFGTSAGNLRLDVDIEVVHAELHALLEAAGRGRRPPAGGRDARRAPRAVRGAAAAPPAGDPARLRHLRAPAHPQRRQVAVLRGQHARHATGAGARVRRGAAGHAARARPRGPDLVAVLGAATASCSPRRSATTSWTRSRAGRWSRPPGRRKPRARARSSRRPTRRSWPRRSGGPADRGRRGRGPGRRAAHSGGGEGAAGADRRRPARPHRLVEPSDVARIGLVVEEPDHVADGAADLSEQ